MYPLLISFLQPSNKFMGFFKQSFNHHVNVNHIFDYGLTKLLY